jgi:hypothetical protein
MLRVVIAPTETGREQTFITKSQGVVDVVAPATPSSDSVIRSQSTAERQSRHALFVCAVTHFGTRSSEGQIGRSNQQLTLTHAQKRCRIHALVDRRTEELEYVLKALRHTRQELVANPRLFVPGALERIDKVITAIEEQTQLKAA